MTVSQMKLHTGCDVQYEYDTWAHISDVKNYCARESLNGIPLWKFFLVWIFWFLGMLFMPLYDVGNGAVRLEKSGYSRGGTWVLHVMLDIPSALTSWRCIKIPKNFHRFSTEVLFWYVTLTQNLKLRCCCTHRISTFQLSLMIMHPSIFMGWEIWMTFL